MPEPLRVLVLEDEWPARNYLVQLIEQSGLAHVSAAVPSPALASEALLTTPTSIDVAFVDIHLAGEQDPAHAGLSFIDSIAGRGRSSEYSFVPPRFVLTTASSEHAMRAFELGVVDYLLKPFTKSRVQTALERLVATERPHAITHIPDSDIRIAARQGRSILFLKREETFAFEAEGRLCFVHSARGRLDVDLSLTALESVLGPSYLRVHRNWLVSLRHVQTMERESGDAFLIVGPGNPPLRVSVARDRSSEVRERLLSSAVGLRRDG